MYKRSTELRGGSERRRKRERKRPSTPLRENFRKTRGLEYGTRTGSPTGVCQGVRSPRPFNSDSLTRRWRSLSSTTYFGGRGGESRRGETPTNVSKDLPGIPLTPGQRVLSLGGFLCDTYLRGRKGRSGGTTKGTKDSSGGFIHYPGPKE